MPGVDPTKKAVSAAMPLAFVLTVTELPDVDEFCTSPPAVTTVKVTVVLATGLALPSTTRTDGGVGTAVLNVVDWLFPPFSTMVFAAPALRVIAGDNRVL